MLGSFKLGAGGRIGTQAAWSRLCGAWELQAWASRGGGGGHRDEQGPYVQGRIPDASRSAARREDVGMFQGSQFLQNQLAAHELALSVQTSSRSVFLPAALSRA